MSQLNSPSPGAIQNDWKKLRSADMFARVTRDGATDFYFVQNHVVFYSDIKFSVAFYMDDFVRNYPKGSYGIPLYLRETDHIQCLGEPKDYFSPESNRWDVKNEILRYVPRSAGLLPAVRAYEALVKSGAEITDESICSAATRAYWDYLRRRSKLNNSRRGGNLTDSPTPTYAAFMNHHFEFSRKPGLVAACNANELRWAVFLWLAGPLIRWN